MAQRRLRPERRAVVVSRRRFLELTVAMGGVAVAAACSAPAPASPASKTEPAAKPTN